MSFEPIAADLAVRLTRQQAQSARPDAPVIAPRVEERRHRPARASLAAGLRRLASVLEPAEGTVAARQGSAPTAC